MLRLKFLRLQRNLSQKTLGVLARVSPCDVSLIETGRFIPTPGQLAKLAVVFDVPSESLLQHVEVRSARTIRRRAASVGYFSEVPVAPVGP